MTLLKKLATAVALAFMAYGTAGATIIDCESSIENKVTGATDCERSTTYNNDVRNLPPPGDPLAVNREGGFFDFTDWVFLKKDEGSAGTGQTGSYHFGGLYDSMMLIFKDGGDTWIVGYLVETVSGTWSTPFTNPPFTGVKGGPRDNSHLSYYVRGDRQEIPEPAALGLLGFGLAGLGLAIARRRKKQ